MKTLIKTIETKAMKNIEMASPKTVVDLVQFPAHSPEQDTDDQSRLRMPYIRCLGDGFHFEFDGSDEAGQVTHGEMMKLFYGFLQSRTPRHFVVTFCDSMKVSDELFDLLIYLGEGVAINGGSVSVVSDSAAVRAAFGVFSAKMPIGVFESLSEGLKARDKRVSNAS